jgi:hypothetical protein
MSIDNPSSFGYENYEQKLNQCYVHNAALPPKRPPRPLHRTFFQTIGSTRNRETERWECRHYRDHRVTCNSEVFNKVKRQVKTIRMRQSVTDTVNHFVKNK